MVPSSDILSMIVFWGFIIFLCKIDFYGKDPERRSGPSVTTRKPEPETAPGPNLTFRVPDDSDDDEDTLVEHPGTVIDALATERDDWKKQFQTLKSTHGSCSDQEYILLSENRELKRQLQIYVSGKAVTNLNERVDAAMEEISKRDQTIEHLEATVRQRQSVIDRYNCESTSKETEELKDETTELRDSFRRFSQRTENKASCLDMIVTTIHTMVAKAGPCQSTILYIVRTLLDSGLKPEDLQIDMARFNMYLDFEQQNLGVEATLKGGFQAQNALLQTEYDRGFLTLVDNISGIECPVPILAGFSFGRLAALNSQSDPEPSVSTTGIGLPGMSIPLPRPSIPTTDAGLPGMSLPLPGLSTPTNDASIPAAPSGAPAKEHESSSGNNWFDQAIKKAKEDKLSPGKAKDTNSTTNESASDGKGISIMGTGTAAAANTNPFLKSLTAMAAPSWLQSTNTSIPKPKNEGDATMDMYATSTLNGGAAAFKPGNGFALGGALPTANQPSSAPSGSKRYRDRDSTNNDEWDLL